MANPPAAAPVPPPSAPKPPAPPVKPAKPIVGKNLFSVLAVIAGIILVVVLLVAFAVAKTGVVEVPVFSRFYRGPQPVRVVTQTPMTADAFRVLVSGRLIAKAAQGLRPPYTVRVTEGELTGGLRSVVALAFRDGAWEASDAQVAVTPEYLEFLGRFGWGRFHADTRIRFVPVVEKGGVRFEPTDIRFGDYPLHPSFARSVAGIIFSRDLGTWILTFGDGTLQEMTLGDGVIDIVASPNP